METKKYWQAVDKDGGVFIYTQKPKKGNLERYDPNGAICSWFFLYPIPLKPLQIAEITVCADGTWSYEIEREEGYYMANKKPDFGRGIVQYKGGKWFDIDGAPLVISLEPYTISQTRIPDECII